MMSHQNLFNAILWKYSFIKEYFDNYRKKWSNLNKILNIGSSHAEIYSNETIF